jgi:hypothetical protein
MCCDCCSASDGDRAGDPSRITGGASRSAWIALRRRHPESRSIFVEKTTGCFDESCFVRFLVEVEAAQYGAIPHILRA